MSPRQINGRLSDQIQPLIVFVFPWEPEWSRAKLRSKNESCFRKPKSTHFHSVFYADSESDVGLHRNLVFRDEKVSDIVTKSLFFASDCLSSYTELSGQPFISLERRSS